MSCIALPLPDEKVISVPAGRRKALDENIAFTPKWPPPLLGAVPTAAVNQT